MGRRSVIPPRFDPSVVELNGSLRHGEVLELLRDIHFVWADETRILRIDRDIRDLFLNALAKR
jgi:hypothetical protein